MPKDVYEEKKDVIEKIITVTAVVTSISIATHDASLMMYLFIVRHLGLAVVVRV